MTNALPPIHVAPYLWHDTGHSVVFHILQLNDSRVNWGLVARIDTVHCVTLNKMAVVIVLMRQTIQ